MSEVRLVVREVEREWSGTVHGSCADSAVAALSADPMTLSELETAMGRFSKPSPGLRELANLSEGGDDRPYDAGLVVIDLLARLVVVDSTYSSPGPDGHVDYHDGHHCTDVAIRYHLDDDWEFIRDAECWRGTAEERRRERMARPPLDRRSVLYGRPLLEFIVEQTFATCPPQPEPSLNDAGNEECGIAQDRIRQIHAAWMLTPRDDLRGACPREVAIEKHKFLTWDLQTRADQWSRQGTCPPGLDERSFAYRYGGLGTHELVEYYELVRELLWCCRERAVELAKSSLGKSALLDPTVVAEEVSRLERVREQWLDTPNPELGNRTPRSIIHRERARLPEVGCGHEAIADPDCPCCEMLAELPGPVFWHLDGSEMDDDFAFDMYCLTRAEWEEQQ